MATTEKPMIKINLRLRDELRQSLEAAGEVSGRSLNSEIVARLEESLRADLILAGDHEGRDEQVWLLRRAMDVMNGVSLTYARPWWESYRSWHLVFRALWFLFKQYKPTKPLPLEEVLTAEGGAELARWNARYAAIDHSHVENQRQRRELTIAKRILSQDPFVEAHLRELEAKLGEPAPEPELSAEDMEVWRVAKSEAETTTQALRMILPVLGVVQDRRRKRRNQ